MTRLIEDTTRGPRLSNPRAKRIEARLKKPNRKLQALRINAGMSINDLAYETQVDPKTIRRCEEDGHITGPRIQRPLAEYFGYKPTDVWPLDRMGV
jgi:DNA-binding XRE family transcriptional regulator